MKFRPRSFTSRLQVSIDVMEATLTRGRKQFSADPLTPMSANVAQRSGDGIGVSERLSAEKPFAAGFLNSERQPEEGAWFQARDRTRLQQNEFVPETVGPIGWPSIAGQPHYAKEPLTKHAVTRRTDIDAAPTKWKRGNRSSNDPGLFLK